MLCATINKDGVVRNVRPTFRSQELIPAAAAAEQWRYEPYRVNKKLVEVGVSEILLDLTPASVSGYTLVLPIVHC